MNSKSTTNRKPVNRSYAILSPIQADGSGEIRITAGKVVEVYGVQTFEAYAGAATGVSLTKSDGTTYEICLSANPAETDCSCPGRVFHPQNKLCKHLACVQHMASKGNLPLPIQEQPCDRDIRNTIEACELVGC